MELQVTRRLSASQSTKASEMASMASLRRTSAVAVRSAIFFSSEISTAMPTRCSSDPTPSRTSSARARSHTQLPRPLRRRKTWSMALDREAATVSASRDRSPSCGCMRAFTSPNDMKAERASMSSMAYIDADQ